jgi:hypothetical protein
MDSGQNCLSDFRLNSSEQTLTAARPPRLLTGFPFDYPKAKHFRTYSQAMSLSKSHLLTILYQTTQQASMKKQKFFVPEIKPAGWKIALTVISAF